MKIAVLAANGKVGSLKLKKQLKEDMMLQQ